MDKTDAVLTLLGANGGKVSGRTRLQKLGFLAQTDTVPGWPEFDYIAWDYGPYAKDLQETVDDLIILGLVDDKEVNFPDGRQLFEYQLTPLGRQELKRIAGQDDGGGALKALQELTKRWGRASLDALIRHVYATDPAYTVRSKLL